MGWGRLSIVATVGLGILVFAASAQACSCSRVEPGEALRGADAAIVGRLVAVVPRNRATADYRYRVRRAYKGGRRIGRFVVVRSSRHAAACALPTGKRRDYGLLLKRRAGRWWGGRCGVLAPAKLRAAARRAAAGSAAVASCAS